MTNETLKKFSEELKSVREKKKIKLEQIFNRTRIDIKYLKAIESAEFSVMPDVYIRAFLKEYAEYIGLNANETLEKYKLAQSGKLYEEKNAETEEKETKEEITEAPDNKPKFVSEDLEESKQENIKKQSSNSIYYIFASVVMLIFIYFIYDSFLSDKSVNNVKEKPFAEVLQAQEEPNESATGKVENSGKNINNNQPEQIKENNPKITPKETAIIEQINKTKGNLALTIIGNGKSWMRIVIDDKKNNEFIIEDGVKKKLYANKKFYVHIGNSAAVTLLLNGKELFFKKAKGRVKKFNVTKNGIEYSIRKIIRQNEN